MFLWHVQLLAFVVPWGRGNWSMVSFAIESTKVLTPWSLCSAVMRRPNKGAALVGVSHKEVQFTLVGHSLCVSRLLLALLP